MRRLVLFSALLLGAISAEAQISLSAYRDSVAGYDWRVKNAAVESDRNYEIMRQEYTSFLPHVSAAGSFAKTFHRMGDNKLWSFSLQPRVVQTVYGGGGVKAAYRKAASGYEGALFDEEFTRLEVRYMADYAYWSVSAQALFLRAVEEYVNIIESLYRVVERRFDEGYIAKSDLLQVETRLSEARFDLITARRSYDEALHAFNILRGTAGDEPVSLSQSIVDSISMPERVSTATIAARRPDLLSAEAAVRSAEYGVEVARASYNPQLNVGVGGSWQTYAPNASGRTYLDASLMVELNIPIFHWGERRHAVASAAADVRRSMNVTGQIYDDMAREEADGWSALTTSYSQVQSSLHNLEIAGENLSISTYSYNEGQATVLDVLQAQISWLQIYTNAITARYNYAVAVSAYERITAAE